jgi:hypothetical protein
MTRHRLFPVVSLGVSSMGSAKRLGDGAMDTVACQLHDAPSKPTMLR